MAVTDPQKNKRILPRARAFRPVPGGLRPKSRDFVVFFRALNGRFREDDGYQLLAQVVFFPVPVLEPRIADEKQVAELIEIHVAERMESMLPLTPS
jgi:hypothetical protein